jgi:anti-sigma B factor antagonist
VPSLVVSEAAADGVHVLDLQGELDVSTVSTLQPRLVDAVESDRRVVLDCMGLTFIDSSGMRLLLYALRAVHRHDGCLAVACANPTVLRLFAVTGMDMTFDILPTRAEAIAKAAHADAAG